MKTTDSKVQLDCEKHKTLVPTVRKYTHTEPGTPCERRKSDRETETDTHTHTHTLCALHILRERDRKRERQSYGQQTSSSSSSSSQVLSFVS